ncbi:putative bifunctional diguanylate cyclase/phosphodiesterase [Roseibium sp.]|uniref:putative bifunctional diguanylate cyclase/phosphodiesterase n=1 Tax=Roseibium sp. TaxID=1936156 RepID=UPI003A96C09A
MLTAVIASLADHNPFFIFVSTMLSIVGGLFTIRLYRRIRRESGLRRRLWLFLASMVAGTSLWASHFIALVAHHPTAEFALNPFLTFVSLLIGVCATALGLCISANRTIPLMIEAGGGIIGLGIVALHYVGVSALVWPQPQSWDTGLIAVSVGSGIVLGALSMNRYARPCTRYCELGSMAFLVLTFISVHYFGMAAATFPTVDMVAHEQSLFGNGLLLATITLAIVALMLIVGAAYLIDSQASIAASAKYRYLALHDAITGLPNRQYLSNEVSRIVAERNSPGEAAALLFISLDQFKTINDLHGYGAGDQVLSALAANILGELDEDEFLVRFNGDEFVAFKSSVPNVNEALLFAHKIRNIILRPIPWNNFVLNLHASIGIAMFPDDSDDVETLVVRAALAAKRAKKSGGQQIRTYVDGMEEASRKQAVIAADLKQAVSDHQLQVYFQPQNSTRTGEIIGYEALLRWQHPIKGQIPADDFIPIAEKTGQILEIGQWALETACRHALTWTNPVNVSVNASPLQFSRSNYPAIVSQVLIETGLPAERLEIELTESSIIEDHELVLCAIRKLRAMGVKVSMDDFGTGYSSLNTLQNFPFDKIKVDRVFTQSIESDPRSRAIIRSAVLLGHSFKIPVLAEGVENEVQLAFLKEAGCTQVQGFLFGRPLPANKIPSTTGENIIPERVASVAAHALSQAGSPKRYA